MNTRRVRYQAYIALRGAPRGGDTFGDVETIDVLADRCAHKAKVRDVADPMWARERPVLKVLRATVTVDIPTELA